MSKVQADAYVDPITGDLPAISRHTTGIELIEQRIRFRLQRGLGEWFLDPNGTGLPLLAWRQMKPPDVQAILQIMQSEIMAIPGVLKTQNWVGTHDIAARRLTITGDVIALDGTVTSAVVTTPTEIHRNAFIFQIFFSRGSGSIVRPAFRGP